MKIGSTFFRKQIADGVLSGGNALDLGCGKGRESIFLSQHGYEVDAVDKDVKHAANLEAEAKTNKLAIKVIRAKIEDLVIPPDRYSLIIARHSLPFIADSATILGVINKMVSGLKPEGLACFTLFGERDSWRDRSDMSFFEYEPMILVLQSLPVLLYYRHSEEYFADTMAGIHKFWHIHTFCFVKKPVSDPHLLTLLS